MIHVFEGDSADEVWRAASVAMESSTSHLHEGRGGATRELLHVAFVINNPVQRWIVSRMPSVNPAFAIAEVIWILSGRDDAKFLNFWNSQLPKYAGQVDNYYGAYGHRLRYNFGFDQLERAYQALSIAPESRQVVLQLWDPRSDFPTMQGEPRADDIPCNVIAMLKVRQNKLEWTQVMRSNDIYRGTPYNFIQFTSLHEIIAGWLGVGIGAYHHFSDSLHLYTGNKTQLLVNQSSPALRNSDSLLLSKQESDRSIVLLAQHIEQLISPSLTRQGLTRIITDSRVAAAYYNFLLILAAEAARRRHWNNLLSDLLEQCSNQCLLQVWSGWMQRFSDDSLQN